MNPYVMVGQFPYLFKGQLGGEPWALDFGKQVVFPRLKMGRNRKNEI